MSMNGSTAIAGRFSAVLAGSGAVAGSLRVSSATKQ
jgi:hypothetical protein